MRLVTVIIIVVALGISSVAGFLLLRFVQQQEPKVIVEREVIPALLASNASSLVYGFPLRWASVPMRRWTIPLSSNQRKLHPRTSGASLEVCALSCDASDGFFGSKIFI